MLKYFARIFFYTTILTALTLVILCLDEGVAQWIVWPFVSDLTHHTGVLLTTAARIPVIITLACLALSLLAAFGFMAVRGREIERNASPLQKVYAIYLPVVCLLVPLWVMLWVGWEGAGERCILVYDTLYIALLFLGCVTDSFLLAWITVKMMKAWKKGCKPGAAGFGMLLLAVLSGTAFNGAALASDRVSTQYAHNLPTADRVVDFTEPEEEFINPLADEKEPEDMSADYLYNETDADY